MSISDNNNNTLVRFALEETDDSKELQLMKGSGRHQEMFGGQQQKVTRNQDYGVTSNAPKDSVGNAIIPGGNNDMAMIINVEHAPSRPKNLQTGEVQLYDDQQQKVYLKRDQLLVETSKPILIKSSGATITVEANGNIFINPTSGNVYLGGGDTSGMVALKRCDDTCCTKVYGK